MSDPPDDQASRLIGTQSDSSGAHEVAEPTTQQVHHRAKRGIKLLFIRQVLVQIFTFLGGIVIARKLGPAAFGLFAIAGYLVNLLGQFGDFGLAPSFIQRKAELTERDLRIGFTLQQILVSFVVTVILIAAPWLAHLYPKAPPETVWLVRALAFTLFLSSWRTMSALQLERALRYDRLAWIEVLEVVIYQSVVLVMALCNRGAWSFVAGTVVAGVVGTTLVYLACPWKVRLAFEPQQAREILRYGLPFITQIVFNQLGDWVIPIYVGARIGPAAVGLVTWASANGKKPLIVVDNIMRVAFPHFSRIQNDPAEVERTATRYLTGLLAMSALWFSTLLVAGPALVQWIYSGKWIGATATLALYSASMSFDVIQMVMAVVLNAIGQVKYATRIALVRSLCFMVASIPMVMLFGHNGVPVAILIGQALIIPWIFRGLGRGTLRRMLGPVQWILIPVAGSICIGLVARRIGLPLALQGMFLVAVVFVTFGAIAAGVAPAWLRGAVLSRVRQRLARMNRSEP